MIIAIGVFQWPICGRLVRGVTLSFRENEYILASRATGAHPWWLIIRHILPAVLPPVVVAATLAVAGSIGLEATLSFLGLGVQPPTASWGNMLTDAQRLTVIRDQPWLWLPPGLAVAITVLGSQLRRRRPARRPRSEAEWTMTRHCSRSTDLAVEFRTEDGSVHAVDGVSFQVRAGEIARDRRRVRFRQERDRAVDPRSAGPAQPTSPDRSRSTARS